MLKYSKEIVLKGIRVRGDVNTNKTLIDLSRRLATECCSTRTIGRPGSPQALEYLEEIPGNQWQCTHCMASSRG